MPKKLGYLWVLLVAIGLAFSLILNFKNNHWIEADTLGWFLFLMQTAYVHIEKVYWLIQQAKYNILNPDTVWDLSIKYKTEGLDEKAIFKAQQELSKAAVIDRPEVRQLSNQRMEIWADELHIELFMDYNTGSFQVFFKKLPVSFRGAQRVLNTRIVPILEAIEKNLVTISKQYWLSVFFGNINPFYGLYMRRMKQNDITEFNIRAKLRDREEIAISKDKIEIRAESLSQLANEGHKYLTLSKIPA